MTLGPIAAFLAGAVALAACATGPSAPETPATAAGQALQVLEASALNPPEISEQDRAHLSAMPVEAMLAELDLDGVAFISHRDSIPIGAVRGLPFLLTREDDQVRVLDVFVLPRPFRRSGYAPPPLSHGWVVEAIDGEQASSLSTSDLADLRFRDEYGTATLRVGTDDGGAEFTLEPQTAITNWSAAGTRVGDTLYLRAWRLDDAAVGSITRELQRAAPWLTGVVLDLRANTGGALDEAVATAGVFLDGGAVGTLEERARPPERLEAEAGDLAGGAPMVVLVDAMTARGAELVAGALQSRQRAVIVGQSTAADGIVQTVRQISARDGGYLAVPTGRLMRPDGTPIEGRGVTPDVVASLADAPTGGGPGDHVLLSLTGRTAGEDAQLTRALQVLRDQQAGGMDRPTSQ